MGNAGDTVEFGRNGLRIDDLGPLDAELLGRFAGLLALVPHGYAQHLELIAAVLLPHLADVGNLATAGTAPRSPEVDQHVFALAHVVGEADGRTVGIAVLDGEIDERHPLGRFLQRLVRGDALLHGSEVADVVAGQGQGCVELLGSFQIGAPPPEDIGAQRIVVGLDDRTGRLAQRFIDLLDQSVGLLLARLLAQRSIGHQSAVTLVEGTPDRIVLGVETAFFLGELRTRCRTCGQVDRIVAALHDHIDVVAVQSDTTQRIAGHGAAEAETALGDDHAVGHPSVVEIVEIDRLPVHRRIDFARDGVGLLRRTRSEDRRAGRKEQQFFHSVRF